MPSPSLASASPDSMSPQHQSSAESLVISGVRKTFDDLIAVDGIDLTVHPGEFLTLLGPSGCGKTTLLRMVAGFEDPTAGTIRLGDQDLTELPPERRPLNMVFQRYALFPHLNVADNVAYGLVTKGNRGSEVRRRVGQALDLVDMSPYAARSISTLSGGQSQRVALARALINEPQVLLLDEPLGALDLQLRKRMQVELRAIQHRLNTTFLYVTHDQEEALTMSDRIAVMNAGRIEQLAPPPDVYHRPASLFVADFVGESSALPGEVVEVHGERVIISCAGGVKIDAFSRPEKDWAVGDAVRVVLRPEDLEVVPPQDGRIVGRVVDRLFLGFTERFLIETPDGITVAADTRSTPLHPELGDRAGLTWPTPMSAVVRDIEGAV